MKNLVWILAVVLLLLHQDFWWWDDSSLVFGFLPTGLAYHALYSMLSASLWAMAIKFAWPSHLEAMAADEPEAAPAPAVEG
jgi:hypothetical protein